jgi:hypothetical protein
MTCLKERVERDGVGTRMAGPRRGWAALWAALLSSVRSAVGFAL